MRYSIIVGIVIMAGLPSFNKAQCIVSQDTNQALRTTCTIQGRGSRIQVYQGSPCFTYPIWKIGQLQLDPQSMPIECPIKYDVSSQQVYCKLKENKVVAVIPYRFSLDGHQFINLPIKVLNKRMPTYYDLLYEGKTKLLVWRRRTLQSAFSQGLNGYNVLVKTRPNENSGQYGEYSGRYEETLTYYLQQSASPLQLITLTSKSLLAVLPKASDSIKNLLSSKSLEIDQVIKVLALYDSTSVEE